MHVHLVPLCNLLFSAFKPFLHGVGQCDFTESQNAAYGHKSLSRGKLTLTRLKRVQQRSCGLRA